MQQRFVLAFLAFNPTPVRVHVLISLRVIDEIVVTSTSWHHSEVLILLCLCHVSPCACGNEVISVKLCIEHLRCLWSGMRKLSAKYLCQSFRTIGQQHIFEGIMR